MFEKYQKVYQKEYEDWYKQNKQFREEVIKDPNRLQFHIMPKTGWLNDPNGLCQKDGVYHIYYQYTPFEPTGELKLWCHYTTKDFIHYEDYGPVLFPDTKEDAHGVYSGSAFVEGGEIHYFYTGNVKYFDQKDYDYINSGRGSNTIYFHSKDGETFSKKEVVMTIDDYPSDMSNHVRDPKVIKKDGVYYMFLGARDHQSKGMTLVYKSRDMKQWEYFNRITTKSTFGYMWECPDCFELEGQMFLTICPQGVETDGIDYANVHQSTAMVIDYDFEENDYEIKKIQQLDRGFDFYAQQTFLDEKNRRILIGWMGIPDAKYTNPTTKNGWQHALTIPRQLSNQNGELIQKPIDELKSLRKEKQSQIFLETKPAIFDQKVYEAEVDFEICESMKMELRFGITLSYENNILTLNLGEYGFGRDKRSVKIDSLEHLQIFADTSSLEIFVNHGEEVFTTRIYSLYGRISIRGNCSGEICVYKLDSIKIIDKELY